MFNASKFSPFSANFSQFQTAINTKNSNHRNKKQGEKSFKQTNPCCKRNFHKSSHICESAYTITTSPKVSTYSLM